MQTLKGVLLDVDGTLVDSNDAHAQAWARGLADHGISVPVSAIRKLIGKGGDKLLPEVAGIEAESALGKTIDKRRAEIFQYEYLPTLRPFSKVKELLRRLTKGCRHANGGCEFVEERGTGPTAIYLRSGQSNRDANFFR